MVKKTINGIEIKVVSNHFVDRVLWTIYLQGKDRYKHEGVSIKNVQEILFKGKAGKSKIDKFGRINQNIVLDNFGEITINPDTGVLVQCNQHSK